MEAEWQLLYLVAIVERDSAKLQSYVEEAENAIFLRFQALAGVSDDSGERLALNDALRTLRLLQVEKLHYPRLPNESRTAS